MKKIIIIDDEIIIGDVVCKNLENAGITVISFTSVKKALLFLTNNSINAAIVDLKMPKMDGLDVLFEIKQIAPELPVIIVAGYADIDIAIKAIRLGAYDFLVKPLHPAMLIASMIKAFEELELKSEVKRLRNAVDISFTEMIGKSPAMNKIKTELPHVAQSEISMILQGETGTGKSYLARIIHNISNRRNGPFIKVDISSLPETLIESELFGHVKGSFSGAYTNKVGFFESASGGTIFIDEIDNMSQAVQNMLLGVLDDRIIYPIGSTTPLKVDVRVITATNADIQQSVHDRRFRCDLFYRLSEYILTLPPLRDRSEDIEFFTWKFVSESCKELKHIINQIPQKTLDLLCSHKWKGNIRELRNVIRLAVLNSTDDILKPELITFYIPISDVSKNDFSLKAATIEAEIIAISQAIKACDGNKSKAAEMLQISYRSLLSKIKEYGICMFN
jgi:DNA-binding NtrC family response regulator